MRYTESEALEQVLRRSEQIRAQRRRRTALLFRVAAGALAIALVLVVAPALSAHGLLPLSREAEGYLFAVAIALALGAVALYCLRRQQGARASERPTSPRRGVSLSDNLLAGVAGGKGAEDDKPTHDGAAAAEPGKDEARP